MSPNPHTTYTHCSIDDCPERVADHYWGHVKAEGWFFSKDGAAYCPQHVPEWVAGWRERKQRKR